MLKRYLITLGAQTTAGGKVSSARSLRSVNSANVALEGDKVWCPKCNSEGTILPDGPRLTETYNGKRYALNDDLCICKCNPPPRLVANQDFVSQSLDVDWQVAETVAAAADALNSVTNEPSTAVED
jgi:uncharacterized Zn-binding protein involved in type VI secretion